MKSGFQCAHGIFFKCECPSHSWKYTKTTLIASIFYSLRFLGEQRINDVGMHDVFFHSIMWNICRSNGTVIILEPRYTFVHVKWLIIILWHSEFVKCTTKHVIIISIELFIQTPFWLNWRFGWKCTFISNLYAMNKRNYFGRVTWTILFVCSICFFFAK